MQILSPTQRINKILLVIIAWLLPTFLEVLNFITEYPPGILTRVMPIINSDSIRFNHLSVVKF